MTRKALVLAAAFALLLLLVVGFAILKMTDSTAGAAATKAANTSSAAVAGGAPSYAASRARPVALHGDDSAGAERAAGSSAEEPPELEIAPIQKAYVQREDGSMRAKDAPPPLFRASTIDGIRAAVTPAIQRCIAEGLAHAPEQRELDTHPSVSIIYTASAAGGSVVVTKADVTINGTQDDTLLSCVEAAYKAIQIRASSDQPDGEGKVIATFDYK